MTAEHIAVISIIVSCMLYMAKTSYTLAQTIQAKKNGRVPGQVEVRCSDAVLNKLEDIRQTQAVGQQKLYEHLVPIAQNIAILVDRTHK